MVEVPALTEAHDDVELAVLALPGLPVGHDVGVPQLGQQLGLLLRGTPLPLGGLGQVQLLDDVLRADRGRE